MNEIFVALRSQDRLKGNPKRILLADKEVLFVFAWKFKVIFSFNFDTSVCICSGSAYTLHFDVFIKEHRGHNYRFAKVFLKIYK